MRIWLGAGAASAFVAVAMGAFAAHGLESRLSAQALDWIDTGARYGLAHGLALVALAGLSGWGRVSSRLAKQCLAVAGSAFALGALLFSVTLYLMALTDARDLAVMVPLGGAAFLLGWAALFAAALAGVPQRQDCHQRPD